MEEKISAKIKKIREDLDTAVLLFEYGKIRHAVHFVHAAVVCIDDCCIKMNIFEKIGDIEKSIEKEEKFQKQKAIVESWHDNARQISNEQIVRDGFIAIVTNLFEVTNMLEKKSVQAGSGKPLIKKFFTYEMRFLISLSLTVVFIGVTLFFYDQHLRKNRRKRISVDSIFEYNPKYLGDKLKRAEISQVIYKGEIGKPKWDGEKWEFDPLPQWFNVYGGDFLFNGVTRQGIFLHPYEKGPRTVTFKNQKLEKKLVVFYGIRDRYVSGNADVKVTVKVGKRVLKTFTCKDQKGYKMEVLDTSHYRTEEQDISFSVETKDSARRHFCFAPYIVKT